MASGASSSIRVLLVEDNATHAHVIERHLKNVADGHVRLESIDRLEPALERLSKCDVDVLLLDLSLPDSPIGETLPRVIRAHGELPIIALTSLNDLEFATRAVAEGAQDFLVKSDLSGPLLLRSINYAIERRKTQERLESYAAELETSNEQLKGFAHTVAHEVKSPLTVVSACLQMLQEHYHEQLDRSHWESVEDATAAVRGMTEMVNDLLAFSCMAADRPVMEPADMEAVFYHAYVCLRPLIKRTGAVVTHDPLPSVLGHEIHLRQLLLNLVGNAIKYRGSEAPRIHVEAVEQDGEWLFSVRDNGTGIAPADQKRVFEAFVRVHPDRSVEGSGIGLALCQRIVRSHGGRIWVESNAEGGSTFCFTLPIHAPASHD